MFLNSELWSCIFSFLEIDLQSFRLIEKSSNEALFIKPRDASVLLEYMRNNIHFIIPELGRFNLRELTHITHIALNKNHYIIFDLIKLGKKYINTIINSYRRVIPSNFQLKICLGFMLFNKEFFKDNLTIPIRNSPLHNIEFCSVALFAVEKLGHKEDSYSIIPRINDWRYKNEIIEENYKLLLSHLKIRKIFK